ncbi:MAG TPA: hypothetical protein VF365_11340 [Candidatus Limnocylindria bacterium]
MRTLRLIVAATLTAALLAGPAAAAPAGNAIESVSGGGWRLSLDDVPMVEFSVNAWTRPGGAITGSYRYANPFAALTLSGPVTCLDVQGDVAAIGGTVTGGSGFLGEPFLVILYDNGGPTFGEFGPDQVSQTYIQEEFSPDFPAVCPNAEENPFEPDPFSHLDVIGDVTIADAP